ncbi:hypothetical protein CEXT_260891 [Caerostris extrusa]|uniref:Uncharacterized protein n=1 Tax=Caerostris extrusa TaxID=172846 RepID=A0AAV4WKS6_CAEEX|nr:hypothetical protein CEXT_260891 [Caerostris extrusa]
MQMRDPAANEDCKDSSLLGILIKGLRVQTSRHFIRMRCMEAQETVGNKDWKRMACVWLMLNVPIWCEICQ